MNQARVRPDGGPLTGRPGSAGRPVLVMPDGEVVEWPAAVGGAWSGPSWPARFEAAARLATMVCPGPMGELVERELRVGLVCAGRFGAVPPVDRDALLIRVVEHVLGTVERRMAVVESTARANACSGTRTFRPGGSRSPTDLVDQPLE